MTTERNDEQNISLLYGRLLVSIGEGTSPHTFATIIKTVTREAYQKGIHDMTVGLKEAKRKERAERAAARSGRRGRKRK